VSDAPADPPDQADTTGEADTTDGADTTEEADAETEAVGPPADVPYVESPIIMTTVRLIAPFVFTFGLFVMFHGADTPGGGFQGGVIVGSVIVMIGFAFGVQPTREWVANDLLVGLAALGALTFVGIGVGSVLLGGDFLQYTSYEGFYSDASKYLIELVELGIGAIVATVVVGLYLTLAGGYHPDDPGPTNGGEE
jgi:multicomponent Na+:H+ antiporter subunit B